MEIIMIKAPAPWLGKHLPEEMKQKISNTLKGRPLSAERRANISKGHRGKPFSEAHKAALRGPKSEAHKASLKAAWARRKERLALEKEQELALTEASS